MKSDLRETFARIRNTEGIRRKGTPSTPPDQYFRQSCYGLPGAFAQFEPQCVACPLAHECRELADRVELEVKQRTGHTDPVTAHKREQVRVRKQRHDAKLKKRTAEAAVGPRVTLSETTI